MFRFTTTIATLLAFTELSSAYACTICVGLPTKSDADHVIESQCVILAREDRNQPFAFAPVEVLKGEFDGREIDLLVDSRTRRRLLADKQRKVVLAQGKENGTWRSLGIASTDFEAVLRRMLARAPEWERALNRTARVEFFLPLFGHKDPQIYRLAYLELSRAPYPVIRRLGRVAPRTDFAAMLEDRTYLEWRPLAILLLAQSQRPNDIQHIRDSLESAQRLTVTTNLAAWASAAIEIDGATAIDFLEQKYFCRSNRTNEELREVFKAFSLHGTEDTGELRERIVAAYRTLLKTHPDMAPLVARDMHSWSRADLADVLHTNLAPRAGKDDPRMNVPNVASSLGE